ncbi:hypothetical protein ZWY2020_035103 [Hordeum vulgare]|nr:hypothetical protein ZWY2020_035103 [Hordeum vulgare]
MLSFAPTDVIEARDSAAGPKGGWGVGYRGGREHNAGVEMLAFHPRRRCDLTATASPLRPPLPSEYTTRREKAIAQRTNFLSSTKLGDGGVSLTNQQFTTKAQLAMATLMLAFFIAGALLAPGTAGAGLQWMEPRFAAPPPSPPRPRHQLQPWIILLIVVAAIVGALLVTCLLFALYKKLVATVQEQPAAAPGAGEIVVRMAPVNVRA